MQLSIVKKAAATQAQRTVRVTVEGEVFAVTYNIEGLSLADLRQLTDAGEQTDIARYLARIIVEWELFDGDEQVPITVETLEAMPLALVKAISEAVFADIAPSKS